MTVLLALLLLEALDETHSLVFIVAMPIVVELYVLLFVGNCLVNCICIAYGIYDTDIYDIIPDACY